jgi:hypothetical protein
MDAVDNKYIGEAITTLMGTIGVKEFADSQKIVSLVRTDKLREAIKEIAKHLGLPIEVKLSYVPNKPNAGGGFHSTHLVNTDSRGRGVAGITAQVSIPSYLPFYGSSGMVNFPISVQVRENCSKHPMTFVSVIAHELSHIVLHSMRHKERQNEFYTDLTAMMLGFAEVMKLGRKVVTSTYHGKTTKTETTTYGYLSDSNFDFAFDKIEGIWSAARTKQEQLLKNIDTLQRGLRHKRVEVQYFRSYLTYLDRNLGKKLWAKSIPHHDGHWIASFHQADYTSEFESALQKAENELQQSFTSVRNLSHYNDTRFENARRCEEKILSLDIDRKYDRIRGAVIIMKRYVSVAHRVRTFLKIKLG